ncbi:MAG: alpha/beta hydrolase [Cytophagales bacterium]|nr:alpha/beta hydrolase [Cytophagales bacterium]
MKLFFNILKVLGVLVIALFLIVFCGPKASFEEFDAVLQEIPVSIAGLDQYLAEEEAKVPNIKTENESRIIWADSVRQTEYALVYLHGFSAGVMEGAPLHQEVASRYGMNLYLPRLSKHGIADKDIFAELTPKALIDDAKEALVIGRKLGKKVILMSCSTGSTLAIYLLANHPNIAAHISYSANIEIFDPTGKMMTGPWGLQIVKQVVGDYRISKTDPETPDSVRTKIEKYWYEKYRVEGLVSLQGLIDMTMTEENFKKVNQPYFLGYYYKNDTAQDMTVSVAAIRNFDSMTATPAEMKRSVAFEEAGSHVINSPLISKEYEGVRDATYAYLEEVLGFEPNP